MKLLNHFLVLCLIGGASVVYSDGVKCNEVAITISSDSADIRYLGGLLYKDSLDPGWEEKFLAKLKLVSKNISESCPEKNSFVYVIPHDFLHLGSIGKLLSQAGFGSFVVSIPKSPVNNVSTEKMLEILKKNGK